MSKEVEILNKIHDKIEFLARLQAMPILENELKTKQLRLLYDNTGTGVPRPKLAKMTGFSEGKISGLWADWELKGLLKKEGKSYKKALQ